MIDDFLDVVMPTSQNSASLCFGRIAADGQVYLEPGDALISPAPPSLVTLVPGSRFAAIMQGRDGEAQSLLIVGLIGGSPGVPSGSVQAFAGASAPDGWLLCQGQAVSRTQYPILFGVIGTTYGSGNGSTSFNLPDYRGRTLVGVDSSQSEFATLGKDGGAKTHTLTIDETPEHRHQFHGDNGAESYGYTLRYAHSSGGSAASGISGNFLTSHVHAPDGELVSGGGMDKPHNNLQPYLTAQFIIKT